MDWRDEGILLHSRPHGENGAVVEVLTSAHGRHAGHVRAGQGQKISAVLQPGAQVSVEWRARLEDQLGNYRIEPIRSRAAHLMENRATLEAFNAMAGLLVALVPEREPDFDLYEASLDLVELLVERHRDWPAFYARWEIVLLAALGYGLDLDRCAATGTRRDLAYVSPRTGRAVCREAGGPWADRLLPLAPFLAGTGPVSMAGVRSALTMSGWFLEHRACPAMERAALPEARARLLRLLERAELHRAAPGPRDAELVETWNRRIGVTRRSADPAARP